MAKKNYDIVEVVWIDAEELGDVGWNNLKDQLTNAKKECPVMKSVGYAVYRSETHISLLSTMGKDVASTLEKIPMSFVTTVTVLSDCQNDIRTTSDNS